MRKTICLLLTIAMILCTSACVASNTIVETPSPTQTHEPTQEPVDEQISRKEYNFTLDEAYKYIVEYNSDVLSDYVAEHIEDTSSIEKVDEYIWNRSKRVDEYIHRFDKYFGDPDALVREKEEFIELSSRLDAAYSHKFELDPLENQHEVIQMYLDAAREFFNASEYYATDAVNYAMFGGSEYEGILVRSEEKIIEARMNVATERLRFLATAGLNYDM